LARGIDRFAEGISQVFSRFARALKPGRPFVFTYHHNDPEAYLPIVVALLDATLVCTATLPVAAEMAASLHIAGTRSSTLDSVFVCRKPHDQHGIDRGQLQLPIDPRRECREMLHADAVAMHEAGVSVSEGDLRCLLAGHIARLAVAKLLPTWNPARTLDERMGSARDCLRGLMSEVAVDSVFSAELIQLRDKAHSASLLPPEVEQIS